MQKAVGVGMHLLVALNAVHVEAHAANCLYKDLYEWEKIGVVPWVRTYTEYGEG
jgi:hypothetical protein